jgi:hypothetical protein
LNIYLKGNQQSIMVKKNCYLGDVVDFYYFNVGTLKDEDVRVLFVSMDLKNKRKKFYIILDTLPLLKEENIFKFFANPIRIKQY